MRQILQQLNHSEKTLQSHQLCSHLSTAIQQHKFQTVASFAALPIEPDLSQLQHSLPQVRFAYPKITSPTHMDFHVLDLSSPWVKGPYGILEPGEIAPICHLEEIDLILCPAYAYDFHGNRLGKGGGFYDRVLPKLSSTAQIWGTIFTQQQIPSVPHESHDIPVQQVFTANHAEP